MSTSSPDTIKLQKQLQEYYRVYFSPKELLNITGSNDFSQVEIACMGFPYMKTDEKGKTFKKNNTTRKMSFSNPNQIGHWLSNFTYYGHQQGPAYKVYYGSRFASSFSPSMTTEEFQDIKWDSTDLKSDIDIDGSIKIRQDNCQCQHKTICNNCLEIAKEAIYLLVDTLHEDFGIYKDQLLLLFSGREGFHVHYPTHTCFSPTHDEKEEQAIRKSLVEYLRFVEEFVKKESGKRKDQATPEDIDIRLLKPFGQTRLIKAEAMRIRIETTVSQNFWRYTPFEKLLKMEWYSPDMQKITDIDQLRKQLGKIRAMMVKNPLLMLEKVRKDGKTASAFFSQFNKAFELDYKKVLENVLYYRYPRYDPNPAFDTRRLMKVPNSIDASSEKKYLVQVIPYSKLDTFTLSDLQTLYHFVKE